MPNEFDVPDSPAGFGENSEGQQLLSAHNAPAEHVATPVVETIVAPVDAMEEFKRNLPAGLKESIKLLQDVDHYPATREDQKLKDAAFKIIRAHVFALQQTPTAPPITGEEMARPDPRIEIFLQRIRSVFKGR